MRPSHGPLPHPPTELLSGATLFLDFDGTLVEFAHHPEAVVVSARLQALVRRLSERLLGRFAIISGRPADRIKSLFGDASFAIGGSHGLELSWPDGRTESGPPPAHLAEAAIAMDQLAQQNPGMLVERKPYSVALHFRVAPHLAETSRELAFALAQRTGLQMLAGNMVVELKAPTADKGSAVRAFMADGVMAGTRPVFIGDDITDEAGFAAVRDLGGAGILVGPPRTTSASYALGSVVETLDWLDVASEAAP